MESTLPSSSSSSFPVLVSRIAAAAAIGRHLIDRRRRIAVLTCALITAAASVSAESLLDVPDRPFPIRPEDRHLASLLDIGLAHSPTFRQLVTRISQSDVVVYVQRDRDCAPEGGGRLTFLATHAGIRYVVVHLGTRVALSRQVALLGHELQHAVEVAETPSIVDTPTLASAYARLGYPNRSVRAVGLAFDTRAAVDAGNEVLRELRKSGSLVE